MLLYSGLDKITLLPALPEKWEKGSVSGLRTRTGAVVDIAWDKDKVSATLTALYDTTFKVRVKDGEYTQISLKKGEKYVI
jgi:alpha-L-fucosidase 2